MESAARLIRHDKNIMFSECGAVLDVFVYRYDCYSKLTHEKNRIRINSDTAPYQYGYDFSMPIGTLLIASRAGTVTRVLDTFADGTGVPGEENVVGITHSDGSVALYFHLAQNGAMVALQQTVAAGYGRRRNRTDHFQQYGSAPKWPAVRSLLYCALVFEL